MGTCAFDALDTLSRNQGCFANRMAEIHMELRELKGAEAFRELAKGVWGARWLPVGLACAGALYAGLFYVASQMSVWVGLGDQWEMWRWCLSCSGAASEALIAFSLPFFAGMDDPEGPWTHGEHHRSGPHADEDGVWFGVVLGAVVMALDLARYAAPYFAGAPWLLKIAAIGWWGLIDLLSSLIIATAWFGVLLGGYIEIWRTSRQADEQKWRRVERESLEFAAKKPKSESIGPKRL